MHRASFCRVFTAIVAVALMCGLRPALAGPITVPNGSFEGPDASASPLPDVDAWTKAGPERVQPHLGQEGLLDTGVFINQPQGTGLHITGVDGAQLAFMGAQGPANIPDGQPPIALYQQLPDARFEVGRAYHLVIAVGPASSAAGRDPRTDNPSDPDPDAPPAVLGFRFYYLPEGQDPLGPRLDVATGQVRSDQLQQNRVIDFELVTNPVHATDPWRHRPIGLEIAPQLGLSGFWNLDNVRVYHTPEPTAALLLAAGAAGLLTRRRRTGASGHLATAINTP